MGSGLYHQDIESEGTVMRKTQIISRQVNLKNKADYCVCLYANIIKEHPVLGCKLDCDRYAGIEAGFVVCGQHGANKVLSVRQPTIYDLRKVLRSYGEDERNCCGAYGKPVGLKQGY